MVDYSKYSDKEIAEQLAEMIRVVDESKHMLDLYERTKSRIEFEFQMRYDKKFREEHSFLLPSTSGTIKETIDD